MSPVFPDVQPNQICEIRILPVSIVPLCQLPRVVYHAVFSTPSRSIHCSRRTSGLSYDSSIFCSTFPIRKFSPSYSSSRNSRITFNRHMCSKVKSYSETSSLFNPTMSSSNRALDNISIENRDRPQPVDHSCIRV